MHGGAAARAPRAERPGAAPEPTVLGQCWAALHDGEIVAHLWMTTPPGTDRAAYRAAAREALGHLGELVAGEIVQLGGRWYLRRRTRGRDRRALANGSSMYPFRLWPRAARPPGDDVPLGPPGRDAPTSDR